MKFIVCCIVVIANISNNGKASLDSFVPASSNILFEDTTKNTGMSLFCLNVTKLIRKQISMWHRP